LKTLADSIRDIREILGGEWDVPKPKPGIQNLADGPANSNRPKRPTWGDVPVVTAPGGYVEVTDKSGNVLHGGHYDSDAQLQNMMKRWNTLKGATGGSGSRGGSRGGFDVSKIAFDENKAALAAVKMPEIEGGSEAWKTMREAIAGCKEEMADYSAETANWTKNFDPYRENMDKMTKAVQQQQKAFSMGAQAAANLGAAFASIEDPAAKAAGVVISAIANIALGFAQAAAAKDTVGSGWAWLAWLAAGTAAMATTISTIHSLTGYAQGGIIKGNSYSGDNIGGMIDGGAGGFVGLNAGEVVLNTAQTSNVAAALTEGGREVSVHGRLVGEDIFISADRYARRSGRGEILTWKHR
jgi:hypothetical protein